MSNAVGNEDLVPEQTEGFKVGEKKTIDEYQQLGESTSTGRQAGWQKDRKTDDGSNTISLMAYDRHAYKKNITTSHIPHPTTPPPIPSHLISYTHH